MRATCSTVLVLVAACTDKDSGRAADASSVDTGTREVPDASEHDSAPAVDAASRDAGDRDAGPHDAGVGESAIINVEGSTIYSKSFVGGNAANVCGGPYGDNGPQAVEHLRAHTADALTLQVTSTIDQDPSDESFGFDNVRVMVR